MRKIMFLKFFLNLFLIFISSVSIAQEDNERLKEQINSYFSNLKTLEADFIQIGPSGNVSKGKLYIDFPGKIRFDYKSPNNLLITSQGFWLYVQDRKLKQTNNIPISETPLNYLLEKSIRFNNKSLEIKVKQETGLILLMIKDLKTYNDTTLTLHFTENPLTLKKWVIVDEFNNQTSVLLQNLQLGNKISYLLFFPDEFDLEGQ